MSGCLDNIRSDDKESTIEMCTGDEEEGDSLDSTCSVDEIPVENNTGNGTINNTDNGITNNTANGTTNNTDNGTINNTDNGTTNNTDNQSTNNTEPIVYGPWEGLQVPIVIDQARSLDGTWQNWSIYDFINESWNGTPLNISNGTDHKWIFIEFASTDCSHCWYAADDMTFLHENYSEVLTFVTFAVNFSSNNNFNASQEEIAAFQDKSSHTGCYQNSKNCNERPGEPHNWTYVDDRDQTWMWNFSVSGTPSFFIIHPDGVVAWNQYEHNGEGDNDDENVLEALERFFYPMSTE